MLPRVLRKLQLRSFSDLVATRYTQIPAAQPVPKVIAPAFSLSTADAKQRLSAKTKEFVEKYGMHHADVGSSQVQGPVIHANYNFV
jgi:hypothetical protein